MMLLLMVFGLAETPETVTTGATDDDDFEDLSRVRSRSLSLCDLSLRFSSRRCCCSSYFLVPASVTLLAPVLLLLLPTGFAFAAEDVAAVVGVAPAFSLLGLLLLCLLLFSFLPSRSDLSGRVLLALRSDFCDEADDAVCAPAAAAAAIDGEDLLFGSGDTFDEDDDDLVAEVLLPPPPPDEPNRLAYCAATFVDPSSLPLDDLYFLLDASPPDNVDDEPLSFGLPISCCDCCAAPPKDAAVADADDWLRLSAS